MSIIVKGIKMPENCLKCPMQFGGFCSVQPPEIDEARVAPTVDEAWEQGKPEWCPLTEIQDVFPCYRIKVTEDGKVCVVKDTCEGCAFDSEHCAINDMLDNLGILKNWETVYKEANFRERIKKENPKED